jgi:sarcosine oxidase
MNEKLDTIILGLGGMGSAAACHLAGRGHRVLGLEQFTSPHNRGSSHGETRLIRQAYYESPVYVPLLLRAYELWQELERNTRRQLLTLCGGLMMGLPESAVVTGSRRSALRHGLAHEMLDTGEIQRRFPPIRPPAGTVALLEKNAGFVFVEASVKAHLDLAQQRGAELHFEEEVLGWEVKGNGIRVRSSRGWHEAQRLVITAGPWTACILSDLCLPLVVERQVLYWFDPIGGFDPFLPDRFPIFIYEAADGSVPYGLPAVNGPEGGAKVSLYRLPRPSICTPGAIEREINREEIENMRKALSVIIPSLSGRFIRAATCMYTNTPDKNFILDTHPTEPRVAIAAGFSGHGYKFCSVVGEILADLAETGSTRHEIAPFRLSRFTQGTGGAAK